MKVLVFFISIFLSTGIKAKEDICDANPIPVLNDFQQFQNPGTLDFPSPYYLYYEAKSLEGLQEVKNCLDYLKCGKSQESIVDDPKNYRLHIWTQFTMSQLKQLVHECPAKDLKKNLTIRVKDQKGTTIPVSKILKEYNLGFKSLEASPAIFKELSVEDSKKAVEKIGQLLKQNKADEAQELVLKTWGISTQEYKLRFTGKDGGFAVAHHGNKTIEYGKDWIKAGACEFTRMIRHEAEHVAQYKASLACGKSHNFSDHDMRERAAHLNDARFLNSICPGTPAGLSSKNHCLNRFRDKYFKD